MKPVYERFIENPDFTKSDFVELIKCAEDPEAVRRLKEEAVRIREIYYGKKVFTLSLIHILPFLASVYFLKINNNIRCFEIQWS